MSSSVALSTQPFEATRQALNTIDLLAFEPMCKIDVLATIPRLAQTAINSIGLADGAISSLVLCLASFTPLPESIKSSVKVWRDDAWNLTCQLADKIARLIIAAIPFAGTHILSLLDHYIDSNKSISGELNGLRATGLAHDSVIARNLDTIKGLRGQIQELGTSLEQLEQLKQKNAELQGAIEIERKGHAQELRTHKQSLKQAHSEQEQIQRQLTTAQDQLSKLHPENSSLKEQLQALREKVDAVTRDHESCAGTLSEAQKVTERVRVELEQEKKKAETSLADLEAKLGQTNKMLADEKRAKSSAEQKVADLQRRVSTLTSKNRDLKAANDKLRSLRSSSPKASK